MIIATYSMYEVYYYYFCCCYFYFKSWDTTTKSTMILLYSSTSFLFCFSGGGELTAVQVCACTCMKLNAQFHHILLPALKRCVFFRAAAPYRTTCLLASSTAYYFYVYFYSLVCQFCTKQTLTRPASASQNKSPNAPAMSLPALRTFTPPPPLSYLISRSHHYIHCFIYPLPPSPPLLP